MDMMYLRRLFYARLGFLSRERKELLRQANLEAMHTTNPASNRATSSIMLAQQLQDNIATEYRVYMQLISVYRRGVSLPLD